LDSFVKIESREINKDVECRQIKGKMKNFKDIIDNALREKCSRAYPGNTFILEMQLRFFERWSPFSFFEKYTDSECKYPLDRLKCLCQKLQDVQLQFFYLLQVDLGLYNDTLYNFGYNLKDPLKSSPLLQLTRLSYDQSFIVKSRIVWEKIMNFVFYLETGKELDDATPKKKSKKGTFFKFVRETPQWKFLEPYEKIITNHDNKYRTPETHKGSMLKKELFDPEIDIDELKELLNYALNCIWENIILIILGKSSVYTTALHSEDTDKS
jgi:hypothetical protein